MTFSNKFILGALLLIMGSGCKKAVELPPSITTLDGSNVFTTDGTAASVVSGLYSRVASGSYIYTGSQSMSVAMGLAADEIDAYPGAATTLLLYYTNGYTPGVPAGTGLWTEIFRELYAVNTAIDGITNSGSISAPVKQELLGELKFMRGFIFFYATNLYGDVPLVLTNDYVTNNSISRSSQADVYKQIVKDLTDAAGLLADNAYQNGLGLASTARIRPNKQAAEAMLARVYLYQKDWKDAETQASAVLSSPLYMLEPNLNQVFLVPSKEAIWQLQAIQQVTNNPDAGFLVVNANPGANGQTPLSPSLVNAFEPGDARFTNWVGQYNAPASGSIPATTYYFAYKYKVVPLTTAAATVTEYPIILRLSEQYLIRAEARAQQGNLDGAKADLKVVRNRAGLGDVTATTSADMLTAVMHERQVELFTEWGHRWFDLIRNGQIDGAMTVAATHKGITWAGYKALLPVPSADIVADPNLSQNPGYNN